MADTSVCDECSTEIEAEKAQTCEFCAGTYCEAHIGESDHQCDVADDEYDDGEG